MHKFLIWFHHKHNNNKSHSIPTPSLPPPHPKQSLLSQGEGTIQRRKRRQNKEGCQKGGITDVEALEKGGITELEAM